MQDIGSQAISSFASKNEAKNGEDCVEVSRIDDLILEQINALQAEINALKSQINEHEKRLDRHTERIDDLDYGRDLQPKQKDRSDVLLALLRDNQGKMLAKDARKKMGLKKATFSVLLKSLKDEIDKKPYHLNKRQLVISLR